MPPDGLAAIEHARQHYGTEGDFAALRDRFGCRAPARYEAVEEDDADAVLQACDAHLGAMLEDRCWTVHPIWSGHEPKIGDFVQITVTEQTVGISRAGFGCAFIPASDAEYIAGLAALKTIQEASARAAIERDRQLYGTGFGRLRPGGTLEHIPAPEMLFDHGRFSGGTWGESPLQAAAVAGLRAAAAAAQPTYKIHEVLTQLSHRIASECTITDLAAVFATGADLRQRLLALTGVRDVRLIEDPPGTLEAIVDGGDPLAIRRVLWSCTPGGTIFKGSEVDQFCDDEIRFSRPGDATARWITTIRGVDPASGRRAEVRLDGRNTFAQVDEHGCGDFDLRDVTASADTVGWLQRMNSLRATFELDAGPAFRSYTAMLSTLHVPAPNLVTLRFAALHVNGIGLDAPFAVGDPVEWRPDMSDGWRPGIVTSIVDDRRNDGVDKPYWVVRIDSAGERRFGGPAVLGLLRRHRREISGVAPRCMTLTCGDENITLQPTSGTPQTIMDGDWATQTIIAPVSDCLVALNRFWRARSPLHIDGAPTRWLMTSLTLASGRDGIAIATIRLREIIAAVPRSCQLKAE